MELDRNIVNKNGSCYCVYRIDAKRNINPKANRKEQEVIIVGYPKDKIPKDIKEVIKEINDRK